jgi:hypothetical protein
MTAAEKNVANAVNAVADNPVSVDVNELWDKLGSQIYRVVDEEGVNVEAAQIRHMCGNVWLYVSDNQGFLTIDESDVETFLCVREELHIPCGWDRDGSVKEI